MSAKKNWWAALLVMAIAVVGFSIAGAVPGFAAHVTANGPSGSQIGTPAAATSGPITPLAQSASGLSPTSPSVMGQYIVEPQSMAPAGASPLPSEVTATVALTPSANLENFVNELSNPNNPAYRHFLTINEVGSEFGSSSYATAVQYFESYGLTVQLSAGLLTLSVSGTPSEMGAAFHTTLGVFSSEYQSNGTWNPVYGNESEIAGTTEYGPAFYANTEPLALPASLEGVVAGVAGLSGLSAQPDLTAPLGAGPGTAASAVGPTTTTIQGLAGSNYTWSYNPSSNVNCEYYNECGNVQTLYPSTMPALDGAMNLWNGSTTINSEPDLGQGITIALVEVGCLDTGSIQQFSNEVWTNSSQPGMSLADRITQIQLNSPGAAYSGESYNACLGNGVAYGWTAETALDVEYAAIEAPDAHIDVIAVNSDDFSAFDVAFADIAQYLASGQTTLPASIGTVVGEDASAVSTQQLPAGSSSITITSNSYGSGEEGAAFAGSPMYLTVEDTLLEELNMVGVTNFFSSGDYSGAESGAANQAGMPAVSPGSTSVGGGQTTAESSGVEFPVTSNIICPAGYESAGEYNSIPYCTTVVTGQGVVGTVTVGDEPYAPTYDNFNGYVYVWNENTASVLSGTSVLKTVNVGDYAGPGTYDSANGYVYAVNDSNTVSVISGTSVVATLVVGSSPYWATYDSSNGYVYVMNYDSGTVSVISGTSVVATVAVGSHPIEATYDSANGYVYVENDWSGTVSVLSGTSVLKTVTVGEYDEAADYDSSNGDVYVSNLGSNTVSVISGTSVVATVAVGSEPLFVTYDSFNGHVYVVNYGAKTVSVLNGTSVVGTVTVGSDPDWVTCDSSNGYIYVTNSQSNTVSIISGISLVVALGVGSFPWGDAYDSSNGYVYVANDGTNTVSVVGAVTTTYTPEECYDYGAAEDLCVVGSFVAPATGLASFSYWAYGDGTTGTFMGEIGGAFGQSITETQPWYQNGLDTYSTGAAIDPIVSFEAAFNMTIYDQVAFGGWEANYGGTSFAAPTVAGEWALVEEQANVAYGTPAMGDINPILYAAHNANEAGVSSFATDPYVDMTNIGVGFDTSPVNSFNWYYYNLSIEQPYDAVLPGWFNSLSNPAGPGWNYLQGLGALNVATFDNEVIGNGELGSHSLLNTPLYVEEIAPDGTLMGSPTTLVGGTTYTFEIVGTVTGNAPYSVTAYSGGQNSGVYGGGTASNPTVSSGLQFTYTPTWNGAPDGAANTYGYFLVQTSNGAPYGGIWSFGAFAPFAVVAPPATGSLGLCVVNPQGICETGIAEVTTLTTGMTGYYNIYPQAFVTLNGVPVAAAVVTEVSVNVAPYYSQDPTMPLSSYAPGATLGDFITGSMGDTNFWSDARTAELNGYLPTQVVTLTASYDGLVSNTVTVFIEPQSGSFDTSNLSLNSVGTAVIGTLTFSDMKYVNFVNVSIGSAPGQYQNTTYAPMFNDSNAGVWVSGVSSGQVAVDLSTAGLTGPVQVSLVASGTNDLTAVEYEGTLGLVFESTSVQNPIVWSDPLTFLPATVSASATGTVMGTDTISWTGTDYAGAIGTLSLVSGAGSTVLATGVSGTYALDTTTLLDGSYSVVFTETAPGAATTVRSVTLYADNQVASDNALIAALQSELAADTSTISGLQATITSLNAQVTTLTSELSAANANVASLQAQVTSLTSQVGSLTTQVSTLQGQLATAQANATSLQSEISALQSENSANATLVASLTAQLATADATIATDNTALANDTTQIASLTAEVQTLQNELNDKKNYVAPTTAPWYDAGGGAVVVLLVAVAAIVAGLGAYFGGRRVGKKSQAPAPPEGTPGPTPPAHETSVVPATTEAMTVRSPADVVRRARTAQATLLAQGKVDQARRMGEAVDNLAGLVGLPQERNEPDSMYR